MKHLATATAALLATTTIASAGGIERTINNYGVLYEDGDYVELGFSVIMPNVSGDYPAAFGGGSTGNMANNEVLPSLSYKNQLTDNISLGFFVNRPYGADAEYTSGPYTGLAAQWKSSSTTLVLKYDFNDNFSAFGGARHVVSSANIVIPPALTGGAAYTAEGSKDGQTSFVAGVAYERPEIALRVALTYEQGFTHTFDTLEGGFFQTETVVDMPQTLTLDFQTGVAQNTLVFGSIRHAEWSVWEVAPPIYELQTGGAVTGFDNDTTTYNIGVAQRLNEDLAVLASIGYEEANGGEASRLAPTDGSTSLGIGARYTMDNMVLSGGVRYTWVGDATDGSGVEFTGNSAVAIGMNIGYRF